MSHKPSSFICVVQLGFTITIYDEYEIINFLVYIATTNEYLCSFSHCTPFININTNTPTNIREIQSTSTLRCNLGDQYTLSKGQGPFHSIFSILFIRTYNYTNSNDHISSKWRFLHYVLSVLSIYYMRRLEWVDFLLIGWIWRFRMSFSFFRSFCFSRLVKDDCI